MDAGTGKGTGTSTMTFKCTVHVQAKAHKHRHTVLRTGRKMGTVLENRRDYQSMQPLI